MEFIFNALIFFLPAGLANMAPVFAVYIPGLKSWRTPMDFGLSWRGLRLFGDNKTWRGLAFGTLVGGLTNIILHDLIISSPEDNLWYVFAAGCALGCGALVGDAIESFFKRRRGLKPGDSWFPCDQLDYIIGGLIFVYPLVPVPPLLMLAIAVIYFGLHLITSYIGYLLGLKPQPI